MIAQMQLPTTTEIIKSSGNREGFYEKSCLINGQAPNETKLFITSKSDIQFYKIGVLDQDKKPDIRLQGIQ